MECDQITGHCFNGCQPGWGDLNCNTSKIALLVFNGFELPYLISTSRNGHIFVFGWVNTAHTRRNAIIPGKMEGAIRWPFS